MFLDKWLLPVFAPETETGTDDTSGGTGGSPPSDAGGDEGEDSRRIGGRSELRKQLEKNFATDRKASERTERKDGRTAQGRVARGTQEAEGEEAQEGTTTEAAAEGETQVATEAAAEGEQEGEQQVAAEAGTAPTAWSKEAKAEWAKLPAAVQQAVKKREVDTAKGVEDLKTRYNEIDQALAPHLEAIRNHRRTPGEAVAHLFAWFAALTANPKQAFPALAKSFGKDLREFVDAPAAGETAADKGTTAAAQQQQEGDVPLALKQYLDGFKSQMEQQFGQLATSFQQSSLQKAKETLAVWSKDKPHYEKVKHIMADMIGKGLIPMKEGGEVDLDSAYDRAVFYDPTIREEILAERQQNAEAEAKRKRDAEAKAQKDKADKARKAGLSLGPSAPGGGNSGQQSQKKGGGKSVRESLQEALAEHRS